MLKIERMMRRTLCPLIFSVALIITAASCNHNKIACPTYKDSFPESNKPAKKPEAPKKADLKKSKSTISHSMGPR